MVEKNQVSVSSQFQSLKYSKEELLSFKSSKYAQKLPLSIIEKFENINDFLDPVLSFDYMEPAHQKADAKKADRDKRKRPREDKDNYYGSNKRNFTKGNRNTQSTRIDNATLFAEIKRGSPQEQRILTERNQHIQSLLDEPIDLFTQRGRNIYSEVKAQLTKDENLSLKTRTPIPMDVDSGEKSSNRFQYLFLDRHKKPEIDAVTQAVRDRDKQLLDLIQGTSETRKQKITAKKTAREVENLLKGILMKNKDKSAEIDANVLQLPRGVGNNQVKTLDEIEASIIPPENNGGNKGAGDMSNFYKLLGFFRNSSNVNQHQQSTNGRENISRSSNNSNYVKGHRTPLYTSGLPPKSVSSSDQNVDPDTSNSCGNGTFNPEQMAMFYRSMHPPPSQQYPGQFMNSPNNIGACAFSADRWLKAMKNAMSASACINQMQQPGFEAQHNLYNNSDSVDHFAYGEDNIGVAGPGTCGQVNNSSPSFDSSMLPNSGDSLAMKFQHQVNVYDGYLPASTTYLPRSSALSASYSPDVYNRMSVIMGLVAPHLNAAIPMAFKAGFRLPYYSPPTSTPMMNPLILQQMVRINNMQQQINSSFRAKSALSSLSSQNHRPQSSGAASIPKPDGTSPLPAASGNALVNDDKTRADNSPETESKILENNHVVTNAPSADILHTDDVPAEEVLNENHEDIGNLAAGSNIVDTVSEDIMPSCGNDVAVSSH